ncbi:MAG: HAD-IB family hydrolase [Treponema sp.]|nr:HAD-IB family hydrolase [Treponema sp.]
MIHIFDIDNTLIKKTSTWYFLREALGKKIIGVSQIRCLPLAWIRYKIGFPRENFIEDAVKYFAGIEESIVDQTALACFECRIKQNIYADAAKLIYNALEQGEKVIFATSSFRSIIRPIEQFFGIEGSLASMLEFRDGKTTGKTIGRNIFGERKKTAAEDWLEKNGFHPRDVCFYSDSYTDIPLLEICGKPFAVNPDWILEREAKKQHWEILRFRKTLGK